ncbi:aldose 1-epimerase family protein [Lichenihabitans psoromatis]|uniref:aldose 1-epimerase family protein n=1 Tax=Lichenihabitans psoromatis TaxID=2528642 RepID=UPI0010385293|nr:aldose 1-epimerase family protein [Lichenihabitans psoromatis]
MSAGDTKPSSFSIGSGQLSAEINLLGAELIRLRDEQGRDLLWDGDPAFWTGRSPLLFPIVGRLKNDVLRVGEMSSPMKQHGFARISTFECVGHDQTSCRLRLDANDDTRAIYPFEFRFEVTYTIMARTLEIAVSVHNLGAGVMPAAMGFHPAFRWPLPYGADRADHAIVFERDEPHAISGVVGGLLARAPKPNPLQGKLLALRDDLFAEDALVFLSPESRMVRYGAAGHRSIDVRFPMMPELGIWSKPGAGFVCIEPWHGYASPEDFDGDLAQKPGMVLIEPGHEQRFGMSVTLDAPTTA